MGPMGLLSRISLMSQLSQISGSKVAGEDTRLCHFMTANRFHSFTSFHIIVRKQSNFGEEVVKQFGSERA